MVRSIGKRIELLRIIAHPVRMRILYEFMRGPQCVTDLVRFLEINQSNVSQHLALLRQCGAVDFRTDGRAKWYFIIDPLVPEIIDALKRDHSEDLPVPDLPPKKRIGFVDVPEKPREE
ncbi:MAG TPA: metalloregulator ArsR/SmtB family transcription factor [Dissulfurispiraceae bacterium]|nr:metalloregulator ArsR/SmtB family transcription factor [Dissulfurispiraceae bacterium]